GIMVTMGKILDGVAEHMAHYEPDSTFVASSQPQAERHTVVRKLKESGAQILVIYLPVGSEEATRFYVDCALDAGVAGVNCIPVFIASNPLWEIRFREENLPIVGDDIKSQLGATITHRVLTDLFQKRGVKLLRTYQLNTGGNTDFLNMLDRHRLESKKISKTEAVRALLSYPMHKNNNQPGPRDYAPWQK